MFLIVNGSFFLFSTNSLKNKQKNALKLKIPLSESSSYSNTFHTEERCYCSLVVLKYGAFSNWKNRSIDAGQDKNYFHHGSNNLFSFFYNNFLHLLTKSMNLIWSKAQKTKLKTEAHSLVSHCSQTLDFTPNFLTAIETRGHYKHIDLRLVDYLSLLSEMLM